MIYDDNYSLYYLSVDENNILKEPSNPHQFG